MAHSWKTRQAVLLFLGLKNCRHGVLCAASHDYRDPSVQILPTLGRTKLINVTDMGLVGSLKDCLDAEVSWIRPPSFARVLTDITR